MSVPFPIGSLKPTYKAFKAYYTSKNGSIKFEKTFDAVSDSTKVSEFFKETIRQKTAPSGTDFFGLIFTLRYFILAKNETRALGALIALKLWEKRVNKDYHLATSDQVDYKVEAIFKKFNLL